MSDDKTVSGIWQRLNIWQKALLFIVGVIWIALSAYVIKSANGDIISIVVGTCALWLVYVAIAFIISRDYGNQGY